MSNNQKAAVIFSGTLEFLAARHKTSTEMIVQLLEMGHEKMWAQFSELTAIAIVEFANA